MLCNRCYQPLEHGEHGVYLCPLERQDRAPVVRPDDIPGGLLVEHGLCADDGTPIRYYSRSAMREAAKGRGLTAWTDMYEESRTRDGREYLAHMKSGEHQRHRAQRREERMERERARR